MKSPEKIIKLIHEAYAKLPVKMIKQVHDLR